LQNPGVAATSATVDFQAADDAGNRVVVPAAVVAVPGLSRVTFNVNRHVAGAGISVPLNISVKVSSGEPLVAERPVYFEADPALGVVVNGGTDVVGALAAAPSFLFAEGTVRPGFVEYVTLQNPGVAGTSATLDFQAADDAGNGVVVPAAVVAVPGLSRVTFNVNRHVAGAGISVPLNISVKVSSGEPLVAERPVYFEADPALGAV